MCEQGKRISVEVTGFIVFWLVVVLWLASGCTDAGAWGKPRPRPSPTASPTPTPLPTPSPTLTPTPVPSPTPTPTPRPSPTPSPSPSMSPTPTPLPTASATPIPQTSPSPVPTPTAIALGFTAVDWLDVYKMVRYGGAKIWYSPTYLELETKEVSGKSGVDPNTGKAINTSSILMRSIRFTKEPIKDFEATITFRNIKFTRVGAYPPEAWEGCLWFAFNGSTTSDKPWNYLVFKTTGLHGGRAYNEVGEDFWPINGVTATWPHGQSFTVVVRKVGRNISIKSNGVAVWQGDIPSTLIRDEPGTFSLYVEDGVIGVSQFEVKRL